MGKKMVNIYRKHKQCMTSKSQHASQKNSIDQILDQIALKKSCGMKYYNGTFLKIYSHTRFKAQFFLKLWVYFQVHSTQKWSKNRGKTFCVLLDIVRNSMQACTHEKTCLVHIYGLHG